VTDSTPETTSSPDLTPTPAAAPQPAGPSFADLGVTPEIAATLSALGYEEPTPIQRDAIPALLAGRNVLGQAATGTGKTAAFALPIVQRLGDKRPEPGRPRALILVPTRELAMQVSEAIHKYGRAKQVTVLPIYGGQSISQQLRVLDRGVDVVVATPGRALDHLERGTLRLDSIESVVLDEADEMLDMGFADDLEAILQRVPQKHQTALFSATLPDRIIAIAESHLADPVRVTIAKERPKTGEAPRVRQVAYVVPRAFKHAALGRVLDMENPTSTIVFCRTRIEVDELTEAMSARGYQAEALHGGFSQDQRDRVMKKFRTGAADLLIATDVAARGLDIEHVSHVVNYDVPSEPEAYVHRIGRTGRAGREGVAITLAEPREHRLLRSIEYATQQKIAIATIPTAADLRTRRLESTRESLREALLAGELEPFRAIADTLASEFDPMDVAAAAVKLAHNAEFSEAAAAADEQDIPQVHEQRDRRPFRERPAYGQREGGFMPRSEGFRPREREGGFAPRGDRGPRPPRRSSFEATKLFIGAGRMDMVRPGDLVGAIANEAGLSSSSIGAIEIMERFSLVEVPAEVAEDVIRALRNTTIRGRKVLVKRDRFGAQ